MTTAPNPTRLPELVYLVPSRGRPGNIVDLVDAWNATRAGAAELVVAVDDDDPALDGYLELEAELPAWCELRVDPRRRLAGTLNALAPYYAGRSAGYLGVGFMGDDHRPRSAGWDDELAGELRLAGPAGVVYGNDLVQGRALPTAVLLGSGIVRALGTYVPTGMVHLWLDNYWRELGNRLGTLRYRPDVIVEHVHPITGRALWDDTYREANADDVNTADRARFEQYVAEELAGDLDRIRRHLELELAGLLDTASRP